MKFMKLGSKPDSFQTDGDNIRLFRVNVFLEKPHLHRYVATELANDIVINVGDVKFYLHKFPLLSKSARLQKLVATINEENSDEIHIHDIPGGPAAFEMCAKFCYGMIVTLNAYNVVAARCAAEYLEMYENIEKGNLVYKIEVFLNSSVFRSWKDSIIVLQTTKSFIPWSEELKMVSHALDSIATKASMDPSKVEWSYTYNRKKLPSENGNDMHWNNVKKYQMIPKDWWVEDLCDLHIDLYRRVITTIKTKEKISGDIIGEALNAYALRRLPGFRENTVQVGDIAKDRSYVETIVWLLPKERGSVPCSFLLRMLRAAILSECAEMVRRELMKRIGQQLEEAAVDDLLIRYPVRGTTIYDVDIVQSLVEEFMVHEQNINNDSPVQDEFQDTRSLRFVSDASKVMVAKLVDGYLAEIARDPNLPLSKFVDLAEMVSGFSRSSHDELYRAIDMYLKEHTGISKSEKKRICRLMDCRKLSVEACMHVVQNEQLPLRVVVQVLFFEQIRATTSSAGNSTPDVPSSGSNGSSRSTTTNTEEEWDTVPTAEDIKALKGEFATLKNDGAKDNADKVASRKMKGLLMSKMFSKLWSSRDRHVEISSSDTSESPGSRSRSHSVS